MLIWLRYDSQPKFEYSWWTYKLDTEFTTKVHTQAMFLFAQWMPNIKYTVSDKFECENTRYCFLVFIANKQKDKHNLLINLTFSNIVN